MKQIFSAYSILFCFSISTVNAQYVIEPSEGFTPQVGVLVDMLEDIKQRITNDVQGLDQHQTDFLFDDQANSIGALVMHLAATEAYYQVETLEGRPFTDEEAEFWSTAGMGPVGKDHNKGKPIDYYLDLWDQVREKTLQSLKKKDDQWLASIVDPDQNVNNHWVWYHVLEHAASHMGQIAMVKRRLPE